MDKRSILRKVWGVSGGAAACLLALPATAQGAGGTTGPDTDEPAAVDLRSPDKSQYTLFNPTPRELWRPMAPDRPDITESPVTVDAGAVQVEMSFIDYAKNGDADQFTVAPLNVKLGLLNNADIQFVFDPYINADFDDDDADGIGDTQVRLKINLWGNDAGDTAFAVMPFVKIPTASDDLGNDEVEGGLIFPWATELADNLSLGLMAETDFVYDEADDDYDIDLLASAALGIGLTESLGAYVEGVGVISTDSGVEDRALLGTGLTYALSDDAILDFGVNLGLHGDVDDVNVFTGVSFRF